jgi:hypothetical protein
MKKLTILLFSILISFSSYAKWTWVADNVNGSSYYIDKGAIKDNNGYVFYWTIADNYRALGDSRIMSTQMYKQGDCEMNRNKVLTYMFYKKPMGTELYDSFNPPEKWDYPSPNSVDYSVLEYACNYVK